MICPQCGGAHEWTALSCPRNGGQIHSPGVADLVRRAALDRDGLLEAADKMADGIRRAVESGALDARSMAADAELAYSARRKGG